MVREFHFETKYGKSIYMNSDHDYLPMHHHVGDVVEWEYDSGVAFDHNPHFLKAVVVSVNRRGATLYGDNGTHYIIDYRNNFSIHKLSDMKRCEGCGEFLCRCSEIEKERKENMTPITSTQLAGKEDGDQISCLQGTLVAIFPANKNGVDSQGRPLKKDGTLAKSAYCLQNGSIKLDDGGETFVCFSGESLEMDDKAVKGKRITITCKDGDKGKSGIKMEESEYNGEKKRSVKITPSATVTVEGGSGASAYSSGDTRQASGSNSSSSPQRGSNGPVGNHAFGATVGMAMKLAGDIILSDKEVRQGADVIVDAVKELAWQIVLASHELEQRPLTKAAPSHDEDPFFTGGKVDDGMGNDDIPWGDPKPDVLNWKTFVHPKRGKVLPEIPDEDLKKFYLWAITGTHTSVESQRFAEAMVGCAKDKKWGPASLLMGMLKAEPAFEDAPDDVIIEVIGEESSEKDIIGFLTNYKSFLAGAIKKLGDVQSGGLPE